MNVTKTTGLELDILISQCELPSITPSTNPLHATDIVLQKVGWNNMSNVEVFKKLLYNLYLETVELSTTDSEERGLGLYFRVKTGGIKH